MEDRVGLLAFESICKSVMAYVKPGSIHRFSAHKSDVEYMLTVGYLAGAGASKLWRFGHDVSRGRRSILEPVFSQTVGEVLSKSIEWCGSAPGISISTVIPVLATALSIGLKGEPQSINSTLSMLGSSDSKVLVECIRKFYPNQYKLLYDKGYTSSFIERENVSVLEVLEVLSSGFKEYGLILDYNLVKNTSKVIMEDVKSSGSLNNSIVRAYLEVIREFVDEEARKVINEVIKEGVMINRESARKLAILDARFRRSGVDYSYTTPLLAYACMIALYRFK